MASGYIRIAAGTPTPIPWNRLVDKDSEDKLRQDLSDLYKEDCTIVSALMPGEVFVPPPGGTLLYDSILIPVVKIPINCGQILDMRTSQVGKWILTPEGGLAWQDTTPVPQQPPLNPPVSVPNVIPGVNSVPADYPDNSLNRALAAFLRAEGYLK